MHEQGMRESQQQSRKRGKTALVAVVLGAFFLSGVSLAEWLASGTGNGATRSGTVKELVVTPGQPSTDLYPGQKADVAFNVTNPNGFAATVRRVVQNGPIASSATECDGPSNVFFINQTGLSMKLSAKSTRLLRLTSAVAMLESDPEGCQGATFTIPLAINGPEAPATSTPAPVSSSIPAPSTTPRPVDGNACDDGNPETVNDRYEGGNCTGEVIPPEMVYSDADNDGLTAQMESERGTDPFHSDTDLDGLSDGIEVNAPVRLSPLDADSDDDGINDKADYSSTGLFPDNPDSDGDGIRDGIETGVTSPVPSGTNPNGYAFAGTGDGWAPDADPSTTTNHASQDTDGDNAIDGAEDTNLNGAIDTGETDPNDPASHA